MKMDVAGCEEAMSREFKAKAACRRHLECECSAAFHGCCGCDQMRQDGTVAFLIITIVGWNTASLWSWGEILSMKEQGKQHHYSTLYSLRTAQQSPQNASCSGDPRWRGIIIIVIHVAGSAGKKGKGR